METTTKKNKQTTLAMRLHTSKTHAQGNDPNCPICKAKAIPTNRTPQESEIMLRLAREGVHPSDIEKRTAQVVAAQTKAHIQLIFGN